MDDRWLYSDSFSDTAPRELTTFSREEKRPNRLDRRSSTGRLHRLHRQLYTKNRDSRMSDKNQAQNVELHHSSSRFDSPSYLFNACTAHALTPNFTIHLTNERTLTCDAPKCGG